MSESASVPNIVLILADDLGYGDVAFTGNPKVKTSNLDRMAREGLRLDRFYSGEPVCTPTRASVLTGRNAFRSGTFWAGRYPLPTEEITIAEILRDAGYRTGFFGKWHLGKLTRDSREVFAGTEPQPEKYMAPWDQGFETCFGAEFSVPTYNPAVWDFPWLSIPESKDKAYIMTRPVEYGEGTLTGKKMAPWPAGFWHEGERPTEIEIAGDSSRLIMDEALKFIRDSTSAKRPFFAVVWFFTPHSPISAGHEDREKYPGLPIREQHWFGAITAMDRQIGRVREELKRLGAAENTLVHFCSDNGPSWVHELNSAGIYRGQKGDLYEGGIRVPAIVEWPARLTGGRAIETALSTDDLLPTLAAAAGVELDPSRPLDGENVLPILQGRSSIRSQPLYFHSLRRSTPDTWIPADTKQSAVMMGPWKLITIDDHKTYELYHLGRDPSETRDLSAEDFERVAEMKAMLNRRIENFTESAAGADYRAETGRAD